MTRSELDLVPNASCMVIVKGDDLWTISGYSPLDRVGVGYHQVRSSGPVDGATKSPALLGAAVRGAIDAFYVVKQAADEPVGDLITELGKGQRAKFFKGARQVSVELDPDAACYEIEGAYAATGGGFQYLSGCSAKIAAQATDEELGNAVLEVFKKVAKKAGK